MVAVPVGVARVEDAPGVDTPVVDASVVVASVVEAAVVEGAVAEAPLVGLPVVDDPAVVAPLEAPEDLLGVADVGVAGVAGVLCDVASSLISHLLPPNAGGHLQTKPSGLSPSS